MLTFQPAAKPWDNDEAGDIAPYGCHAALVTALRTKDIAVVNPIPLFYFSLNPFDALARIGIEPEAVRSLKDQVRNDCPITGLPYFGLVPLALLTRDASLYAKAAPASRREMLGDASWHRGPWLTSRPVRERLSSIERALLGSGYTQMILPHDGSHDFALGALELSNGDQIAVVLWTWFNK